jgi:hypothetical protein
MNVALWVAPAIALSIVLLPGCSGPDWDQICGDFDRKASQCSTAYETLVPMCEPTQLDGCMNEQTLADDIEACTAQDCPGFRSCATEPRACGAGPGF